MSEAKNGSEGSKFQPDVEFVATVLQKILDMLSILDFEMGKSIDANYIGRFRKRNCSTVIIIRPNVFEKKAKVSLKQKYTGEDFILIEYDKFDDEIVQTLAVKLDHQMRTMVDSRDGLLIIED